ncbi:MAG: hypothetical protein U0271_11980 [Polyangiaceae bacterium]
MKSSRSMIVIGNRSHLPVLSGLAALALLTACGAAPPRDIGKSRSSGSASSFSPKSTKPLSVSAQPIPPTLSIDGDLGEWGTLEPADADVVAVVSLSADGAFVAGTFRGIARDGLWLNWAFPAPQAPQIGERFEDGELVPFKDGCAYPEGPARAAMEATCKSAVDGRAKIAATYAARFSRSYRLDSSGVRVLDPDGTLRPITTARVVLKVAQDAEGHSLTRFELALPAIELPMTAALPVADCAVQIVPALVRTGPPASSGDVALSFADAPVTFGTRGAIRALARRAGVTPAYRPGDDQSWVELVRSAESPAKLEIVESKVFRELARVGEVSVGLAVRGELVTLRGQDVVSVANPSVDPIGFEQRGSTLHTYAYVEADDTAEVAGLKVGRWEIFVVDELGNIGNAELEPSFVSGFQLVPFHDDGYTSFGIRGVERTSTGPGAAFTTEYSADGSGHYASRTTVTGQKPDKKKPKKGR